MKIGILGTGVVGKTIGTKLVKLNHEVKMGSRTLDNEKAKEWVAENGTLGSQGTFADAAGFGEIIFNCTKGLVSLEVLNSAGSDNLKGKILIDVSNPLDFSKGFPPTLSVSNDNSLGEEIQKQLPETFVVKALNTMNCEIMVNPKTINGGDHSVFLCGNNEEAKKTVSALLQTFGWEEQNILDLGDIKTSRGPEMFLPLWVRLMPLIGSARFQIKVVAE